MASKSIPVWCIGLLVVGSLLCTGGTSLSVAAEPWEAQPISGQTPMPQSTFLPPLEVAAAPTPAPLAAPLQTPPATTTQTPATITPVPAGSADRVPPAAPAHQTPAACDDDSAEFCGAILCTPPGRVWLRADYLIWWTSGTRLPPLVTTSPQGTAVEDAGVLGKDTTILFGDETVGGDMRSGVRTSIGFWLDRCHVWSLEIDYLTLGERANGFNQNSNGNPILARPFFNTFTGQQASELVAYPGQVSGTVDAESKSYFQSAGALIGYCLSDSCQSCNPCNSCDSCDSCGPCGRLLDTPVFYGSRTDLLIGFRHYNLNDNVGVTEDLLVTADGPDFGTAYLIHDVFRSCNEFYGSEIGLRSRLNRGRWSLDILTKIAIGNNHQTVTVDGETVRTPLGGVSKTFDAGILASGPNGGVYQRDDFTVIPELNLELGYQLNCHWRAFIGYDIIYWGAVTRAADQIDLNVDSRNIPPTTEGGLPFPQFPGKQSAYWAQGINLGAEFRF
jgi:hypothetical protein